jgi:translation initiation factor IF-2
MGKIRVRDLAQKMGVPEQDLLFKLKSIGVRLDEENPEIDTGVIQAILEGKRLPQPREVILRDEEAKASATTTTPRRRPAPRRMPASPVRPGRRRPMIQRVEPRIKTLPTSEPSRVYRPPVETPTTPPPEVTADQETSQATPPPAETSAAAEATASAASKEATTAEAVSPASADGSPAEITAPKAPTLRRVKKAPARVDLSKGRSQRRAERRKQEGAEAGQVLTFKTAAPEAPITVSEGMTVREFADKLGVKAKDLIQVLVKRGIMATINHVIETDLAIEIAEQHGIEALEVTFEEEVQLQQEQELELEEEAAATPRAPVVTIMGHVDHGKTTLLDAIRSSKITESEFGGITQHIGAYRVDVNNKKIVFLDTPGHEAFTMMRARGARATDIVVLVVAADDGVMPQTVEAIDHARAAGVPILVAINKIDKTNANPDRVKKELAEHDLAVEDWGGETVSVAISALKNEGISELMEMILLTAEMADFRANADLPAQGVVLEARKEVGRGIVATVLVQNGSMRRGDIFVAGATWGRIRSMMDDRGEKIQDAGPATPVEVMGFGDVPEAGDLFQVVEEEAKARAISEFRHHEQRIRELAPSIGKTSLEQLFSQIQQGEIKELPIVLKADVKGSVEVLKETLNKLSTDQVKLQVIRAAVGAITTDDVILASASGAVVVGFNVRPERKAADLAEKEEVDIRLHTVIYELSDEIRKAMVGLLEPTFKEVQTGRAEVRDTFSVPKLGVVAGCHVIEGVIPRSASVRLLRDNVVIYEGKIGSLRRFKDDVSEVRTGFDCGIRLDRYQDVKPGDTIEAFIQEEVAPAL